MSPFDSFFVIVSITEKTAKSLNHLPMLCGLTWLPKWKNKNKIIRRQSPFGCSADDVIGRSLPEWFAIFLVVLPISGHISCSRGLGSNGQFVTRTFTDGALCSNDVFSDPIVGVAKACFVKDAPPDAPKPDVVITIKKGW